MSLFSNMGKAFSRDHKAEKEAEDLNKEAQNFDLAGTGGYLTFVKYAVFLVLAGFNWWLFTSLISGAWGYAVGSVAVLSEGFAIYCFNKQNKSVGGHRTALQVFAVYFTLLSFVHSLAAFYEMTNMGPRIGAPLDYYAHFVAFPLVFASMVAGVMVLTLTHWSSAISASRAKAHQAIEASRADLITQHSVMQHQATLERQRLNHMSELLNLERGYVEKLKEYAHIKQGERHILDSITDPGLRARLAEFTGNLVESLPDRPQLASAKDEKKVEGFGRAIWRGGQRVDDSGK